MEHTAAKISNILEQTFIKNIKFHVNLDVQVLYISFYFLSQVIDIRSKTACRLYRATRELLFHEGERLGKDKQIAGVFTQFMQYLVLNCDYSKRYSIVIVQALVGFLSLFNESFASSKHSGCSIPCFRDVLAYKAVQITWCRSILRF